MLLVERRKSVLVHNIHFAHASRMSLLGSRAIWTEPSSFLMKAGKEPFPTQSGAMVFCKREAEKYNIKILYIFFQKRSFVFYELFQMVTCSSIVVAV
jgi:hypothetical protein